MKSVDASPTADAAAKNAQAADMAITVGQPPDASSSVSACQGSALAGVPCASAVINDAYSSCVQLSQTCSGPVSGQCGATCRIYCWSTGTQETYYSDGTVQQFGWSTGANAFNCVVGAIDASGTYYLKTSAGKLAYDPSTGDLTCPDGSSHNIGPSFGGCPEFGTLFQEPSGCAPNGACP